MKQGRGRTRGANRRRANNTAPSVICLPGPKQTPPLPLPRKEPEALRAFVMPTSAEPLAIARSTAKRKPAKSAVKSAGIPLPPATPRIADVPNNFPLPRSRALVIAPQKGLVMFKQWLRKLVMKPKKARLSVETASARTQVRALRVEVAQLQRSLDQLMAQLK